MSFAERLRLSDGEKGARRTFVTQLPGRGPRVLGAWTHQIFSCPFLDFSSFTRELQTVHPPSYRYLSCQSSGWSSRFDAAATAPRRALEIFPLPLETAGLAARAAPGGGRAANRGVADIAAGAVGMSARKPVAGACASRDDAALPPNASCAY